MTATDSPLKHLLIEFAAQFAAWFLNLPPSRINAVKPLDVELPTQTLRADLLFQVLLDDGKAILLHIEIQGKRTSRPMNMRMLDYMNHIAQRELIANDGHLCSTVLYVGKGAGSGDNGCYYIPSGIGDKHSLQWNYTVIRLWELEAEQLLEIGSPALLALVGQTKLKQPKETVKQALQRIKEETNEKERAQLFTILLSLLEDEEVVKMTEMMLDELDVNLLDTPFLRKIRMKAREEGKYEGENEGLIKGEVLALREAILSIITTRFSNVESQQLHALQAKLSNIADVQKLHSILQQAVKTEDLEEFISHL